MTSIRVATYNLENFDESTKKPILADRIAAMKPQLIRLNADIVCFQEVHGQETQDAPRKLLALEKLIEGTQYAGYHMVSTKTADGRQVYDKRNLVVLSRFDIVSHHQYKHDFIEAPLYKKVTDKKRDTGASKISWERPLLYAKISIAEDKMLHVVNVHLKSKIPTDIEGQKKGMYAWQSASGWAEGYFLSSMKRVGQALEARVLVDDIFDKEPDAFIVVCGDFNSTSENVPVQAICGDVENTANPELVNRVLFPCEKSIPLSARYSLFHNGKGEMIDHLLVSRACLSYYSHTEIHNEMLHDESFAFAADKLFPESDHAPVIAQFDLL